LSNNEAIEYLNWTF